MSNSQIVIGSNVDSKSIRKNTNLNTSPTLHPWHSHALKVKGLYKVIYTSHTHRGPYVKSSRTIITCPLTFSSETIIMSAPPPPPPRATIPIPIPIPPTLPVSTAVLTDSVKQRERLQKALRSIEQSIEDVIDEYGMKNDEILKKMKRLPDVIKEVCLITEDAFPVHKCIIIQEYINQKVKDEIKELEEYQRKIEIDTFKRIDILKERRTLISLALETCDKRIEVISPTSSSTFS